MTESQTIKTLEAECEPRAEMPDGGQSGLQPLVATPRSPSGYQMPSEVLDGYEAGLEGSDSNPHLLFSVSWWLWLTGNNAGHHMLCSQLEYLAFNIQQN